MRNGSDVIVVGAGIVGSSTAFHLTGMGVKVTLVEQSHPAGGPTGKSSALLHASHGFKTGPAVGEAIARLVTQGAQPDLAPFSPARFGTA